MEKIDTLVLLVHPLWNKFFFIEKNITDPIKLNDLLKNESFRIFVKSQITTYVNTIKNISAKNKNAHIIIFFPGEEMFLDKFKSEKHKNIYLKRVEEYWQILTKYFKQKLKKSKNIEISSYIPTVDIRKDDFFKGLSIKPEHLSKNLKIISFGEQYSKRKDYCVNIWEKRIVNLLEKKKISVEKKTIENATLKPDEKFQDKIKKLQQKRKSLKKR